mmetsp:Transcript_33482/g.79018  ORF Transcript_33482/g.79018 Transcript_33482/m.79018 type:complete len:210 (-) Transcript_33482:3587-4216(-)
MILTRRRMKTTYSSQVIRRSLLSVLLSDSSPLKKLEIFSASGISALAKGTSAILPTTLSASDSESSSEITSTIPIAATNNACAISPATANRSHRLTGSPSCFASAAVRRSRRRLRTMTARQVTKRKAMLMMSDVTWEAWRKLRCSNSTVVAVHMLDRSTRSFSTVVSASCGTWNTARISACCVSTSRKFFVSSAAPSRTSTGLSPQSIE